MAESSLRLQTKVDHLTTSALRKGFSHESTARTKSPPARNIVLENEERGKQPASHVDISDLRTTSL